MKRLRPWLPLFLMLLLVLSLGWTQRAAALFAVETVVADSGRNEQLQAIAYNSARGEYLVVWQVDTGGGDTDLFGRRAKLDPGFTWLGTTFGIAVDSKPERAAAVAYNANDQDFLVVYEKVLSSTDVDVMGQRVAGWAGGGDGGSELRGGAFGIGITLGIESQPSVAHFPGGQNFIVAYTLENEFDTDIYARRVARRGLGDGGGDTIGPEFAVAADFARSEKDPVVTAVSQQSYFLVGYAYEFSAGDFDVRGQRLRGLSAPGNELLNNAFDIANDNESETQPALAYSPNRQAVLAVWSAWDGANADVWGVWLREQPGDNNPVIGGSFAVADDLAVLELSPAVDIDPTRGDADPVVALNFQPVGSSKRLGLVWLNPNPSATTHLTQSLFLFPDRPFSFEQPVIEVCHNKPGILLGYSARFGVSPNTQDDAHLLPISRWAVVLPMIIK